MSFGRWAPRWRAPRHGLVAALVVLGMWCGAVAPSRASVAVVHLPATPAATVNQQAAAITALVAHLERAVDGLGLRIEIFRHASDAQQFLEQNGDDVVLLFSDAAFLLDTGSQWGLEPWVRFVGDGSEYRRLLVAPKDRGYTGLGDLQQARLVVVELAPQSTLSHLQHVIFEGQLDPMEWFGEIVPVSDDFTAATEVLYGQADAALLAEFNALLGQHLESSLTVLYESPQLSMPIASLRTSALSEDQLSALAAAFEGLASSDENSLGNLGWQGVERLSTTEASTLVRLPERRSKAFELATPGGAVALDGGDLGDGEAAPPVASLPLLLTVELPELPLDPEAITPSGDSRPNGPKSRNDP